MDNQERHLPDCFGEPNRCLDDSCGLRDECDEWSTDFREGCTGDCRNCFFEGGCPFEYDEYDEDFEEEDYSWVGIDCDEEEP